MIEAELHDGRVLEFPDGTDPNVIQSTVKKMTLGGAAQPAAPAKSTLETISQFINPMEMLKSSVPALLKAANYPFEKAGEAVGGAVQSGAEKAGIPSERTAQPRLENFRPSIVGMLPKEGVKSTEGASPVNESSDYGSTIPENLGGIANQAVQLFGPGLVAKALRAVRPFLPALRSDKIATLEQARKAAEEAAQADALQKARGITLEQARQRTTAEAGVQAEQQAAQTEALQKARNLTLEQARQAGRASPGAARAVQEEVAAQAPTAEEAGGKFAKEIYPAQKAAARDAFSKEYDAVIAAGDQIPTKLENFRNVAGELPKEAGVMEGALPTQAERTAQSATAELGGAPESAALPNEIKKIGQKIDGRRNSLQLSEDTYQKVRARLEGGTPGQPATLSSQGYKSPAEMLRDAMGPDANLSTTGDAIEGAIRLRAAKRAARDAGHANIARQFEDMETALTKDVNAASPEIGKDFADLTTRYRKEYVPLYDYKAIPTQIVKKVREDVQQVVPAIIRPASDPHRVEAINRSFEVIKNPADREAVTGAWLRDGIDQAVNKGDIAENLPKWWDRYADPKTQDHVLKTALGDKYDRVKGFIDELRQARTTNFDELADTAITQTLKNRNQRVSSATSKLEGETENLNKVSDQATTGIIKNRDAAVKAARERFDEEMAKITPGELSPDKLRKYAAWHGALGIGMAATGSPYGVKVLATSAGVYVAAPAIAKLLNTTRGAELLTRAVRAAPGTGEAAAVAALIGNYTKRLEREDQNP